MVAAIFTTKQLEKLARLGIREEDFHPAKSDKERIAELEGIINDQDEALLELAQIIADQDSALMELAELLMGGE